jgi:hypothetical protein
MHNKALVSKLMKKKILAAIFNEFERAKKSI